MKTLVLMLSAILFAGCSEPDTWYEDTHKGKMDKETRVEQFKMQGMDQVRAQQTVEFETYWRNTEIGNRDTTPVQGADLQNAVQRPAD